MMRSDYPRAGSWVCWHDVLGRIVDQRLAILLASKPKNGDLLWSAGGFSEQRRDEHDAQAKNYKPCGTYITHDM